MLFMGVADWVQVALLTTSTALQGIQLWAIQSLMKNMLNGAWLLEQARKFCIEFDQILVKYAERVYSYFTDIVGGTLITPEIIDGLISRVYVIIGIFIFFKIMMVAMKYMLNPEQFSDDKLGAQTLVKRIIIGSVIIVTIPLIFNTANKLQHAIIKDRVIEKIILPEEAYKELIRTKNPGRDLSMLVFSGFFDWNDSVKPNAAKKVYNSYNKVQHYNDLTLFNKDYINEKVDEVYAINYVPLISTLAVGYLLFMLLKYAMEVAFRSFKLMFLQVLSPFVIVNYMLDTTQEEMLKKWTNATISTYIMIFIRVMTLWLATLLCYYLNNGVKGESLLNTSDPLLKTLIIIALFAFLKDLPKLISDIFGYNLQENETIGGIMNQGVGILKGFAMGKVAMGATAHLRGLSMASTMTGAAGGAAGGISNVMKKNGGQFNAAAAGSGLSQVTQGFGSIVSMNSSALSSSMAQTPIGSIAQTASASSQVRQFDDRQLADRSEDEDNKKNKTTKQDMSIANNISNNTAFSHYKNGDNFNLEPSKLVGPEGNPLPNPVVVSMAESIVSKMPEGSISHNKTEAVNMVSNKINQELESRNIVNSCSTQQMASVITKVSSDLNVQEISNVQSTVGSQNYQTPSVESAPIYEPSSATNTPTIISSNAEPTIIVEPPKADFDIPSPTFETPSSEPVIITPTAQSNDSPSKIWIPDSPKTTPRSIKQDDDLESILRKDGDKK